MSTIVHEVTLDLGRGGAKVVYSLDTRQPIQSQIAHTVASGYLYEPATSRLIMAVLKPGDTFLDIGAHIGYFTCMAGVLVGPEGKVLAFEPNPRNFKDLSFNVHRNHLDARTIVLPWAMGYDDGTVTFYLNDDNDGGHALWQPKEHPANLKSKENQRSITVIRQAVDDLFYPEPTLNDVPPIKCIKIDCEGAEHDILRGAAQTLRGQQVPFVIAEVNRFGLHQLGTDEMAMRETMNELGYETWLIDDRAGTIIKLGPTETLQVDHVFNLLWKLPGSVIG